MYEMGKQFRNESIDMTHNPEFTSCEFYQACPCCPYLHSPNGLPDLQCERILHVPLYLSSVLSGHDATEYCCNPRRWEQQKMYDVT